MKAPHLLPILIAAAILSPLAVEGVIPALPSIGASLQAVSAQQVVTIFLVGLACGQLLWGPLSDRWGRRVCLLMALTTVFGASIVCAFVSTAQGLLLARWIQGLGASGGPVLARAMIRDRYSGEDGVRTLGVLTSFLFLAPAIAPILGGLLADRAGWRSIFWAISGLSLLVLLAVQCFISDCRSGQTAPALPAGRTNLGRSQFLACAGLSALGFGGMFGFVAASPDIFMTSKHLSSLEFGCIFFVVALGFVVGVQMNKQSVSQSMRTRLCLGLAMLSTGGLFLGLVLHFEGENLYLWLFPCWIFYVGLGMLQPVAIGGALEPFRQSAGSVSSYLGCAQMSAGAFVSFLVGRLHAQTEVAVAVVFLTSSLLGWIWIALFWKSLRSDYNPKS